MSTPGRRASSARLSTVSSPVYASMASGRQTQVGPARAEPSPTPRVSVRREERQGRHDDEQLRDEVEHRHADPGRTDPVAGTGGRRQWRDCGPHRRRRPTGAFAARRSRRTTEVVRQEERGEHDDDDSRGTAPNRCKAGESLNALRTRVAAPPVSGMAAMPSRTTGLRRGRAGPSQQHPGVSPSA